MPGGPAAEASPAGPKGARRLRPGALAWVHDYHLMLVPRLIRERRPDQPVGFFLHVPWPSPDIFARLPWRQEILFGLLGADVVSFHTERYRTNFVEACRRCLADTGVQVNGSAIKLPDQRVVSTTSAPISIDAAAFSYVARDPATSREVEALREQFADRQLLLGVDRLDYTPATAAGRSCCPSSPEPRRNSATPSRAIRSTSRACPGASSTRSSCRRPSAAVRWPRWRGTSAAMTCIAGWLGSSPASRPAAPAGERATRRCAGLPGRP